MNIIKRSGAEVLFDRRKIVRAIEKANVRVKEADRLSESQIGSIADDIEIESTKRGTPSAWRTYRTWWRPESWSMGHTRSPSSTSPTATTTS